jgi:Thioredoxin
VLLPHRGGKYSLVKQELSVTRTRRELLTATTAFVLVGAALSGAVLSRLTARAKADDTPSPGDLATAGPDGDVVLGSDNAPVTIIEYASMTCPHCAHFSTTTFPELKQRYIDTGKVRFIMREFPLDALAASGFMLARCAGNDKYMAIVETLFAKQPDWIVNEPLGAAQGDRQAVRVHRGNIRPVPVEPKGARQHPGRAGPRCQEARGQFHADLLHHGKKLVGDLSIDTMAKEIDPYLKDRS